MQLGPIADAAAAAMRAARDAMSFPPSGFVHRRATSAGGGFPTESDGYSFGGSRRFVGNLKACSACNHTAMDELLADKSIGHMATYPICALLPHLRQLLGEQAHAPQETSVPLPDFSAQPLCRRDRQPRPHLCLPPHLDGANKADGMCLIGALGNFDPDLGGHIVLWDLDLAIRFPPGCSSLIPSAVVTHSNTPIQPHEERFSLLQYSAGSLFRWVANGFKSDVNWFASATAEDVAQREKDCKGHWAGALKKFTLWKDAKVKNFTGRSRVEVWDQGDVADFSDLTEDESDGEQLPLKKRCT
ncbi:hypothetical protein K438DRAFT_1786205 [Mycena galopus ATCC 62051]|nr:hypothetical protein K438DRAFT_1786205 [Mycena galopus ATCC 62051]